MSSCSYFLNAKSVIIGKLIVKLFYLLVGFNIYVKNMIENKDLITVFLIQRAEINDLITVNLIQSAKINDLFTVNLSQ